MRDLRAIALSLDTASIPGDMDAPDFRLDGRVALVTGAGRGIGLGIGEALASAGCAVAIQDIDLTVAEQAAGRLRDAGATAVALGGDVTLLATAKLLVDDTLRELGGLQILVNNASIQAHKPWTALTSDDFERQFRANIITPTLLCQAAAPILRRQRWGRILNIGSIQQCIGNPGMLPYSMSKAALDHLTTALARDLAGDGITVNAIAPGYFNTLRNERQLGKSEGRQKAGEHIPLGRVGEPRDCGGAALLLCSAAGEYITGQTLFVDGGIRVR
jgi:NAD(P)-dependent dehydrogenase (short-subunit alcohol dehydrogenase family)